MEPRGLECLKAGARVAVPTYALSAIPCKVFVVPGTASHEEAGPQPEAGPLTSQRH